MAVNLTTKVKVDFAKGNYLKGNARALADRRVAKVAFDWVADAQTSFVESVSPPGGPPGVDTGALKNSLYGKRIRLAVFQVGDGVSYGIDQEFGTLIMAARPWFIPALERARARMPGEFQGFLNGATAGVQSGEEAPDDQSF